MENISTRASFNGSIIELTTEDHSLPRTVRVTVIIVISLAIVFSNVVNITLLRRTKQIHKVSRMFLTNLGMADLCVGIITCLPSFYAALLDRWPYGAIWCQISGIAHSTTVTISIWTIAVVSLERYVAVLHPLKYKTSLSKGKCLIIIAFLWFAALLSYTTILFTKPNFVYYQFSLKSCMCGMYWENVWLCFVTGIYVPVLSGFTISFATFKINKALKTRTMLNQCSQSPNSSRKTVPPKKQREKSVVKLLAATAGAYFLFWGPYVVVTLSTIFFKNVVPPDWLEFLIMWLANGNSFFNVIVYAVIYEAFREEAKTLSRRFCGKICFWNRSYQNRRIEPEQLTVSFSLN